MSNLVPSDLTLGTGATVGRYFGLVSAIPSLLLSGWIYLLIISGALTGSPSLAAVIHNIGQHQPAQAIAVAIFAIVLALVLHPLQFAMVQLLEGYWGASHFGRVMQARRAAWHVARRARATEARGKLRRESRRRDENHVIAQLSDGAPAERATLLYEEFALAEANRIANEYPDNPQHTMPTRLGNVLRRYETRAGAAYNLPVLRFATHVGLVAETTDLDYLQDRRNQLDLAARMTVTGLIAAVATGIVMWPHGLWVLLALAPYCAAYLSYRGAVISATHYGLALMAVADLNRFRLYEKLHLELPRDARAEQAQNAELRKLIIGSDTYNATYLHPDEGPPAAST